MSDFLELPHRSAVRPTDYVDARARAVGNEGKLELWTGVPPALEVYKECAATNDGAIEGDEVF
jgi:hypothetical protein